MQKVASGKFLCVGDRRKEAAKGGEKHAERAVPAGTKLSQSGKLQEDLIGLHEVVVFVR